MSAPARKKSRVSLVIIIILLCIGAFGVFKVFGPNSWKEQYLYVHTGADYDQLLQTIKDGNYLMDATSFDLLAKTLQLPAHVHPGKYQIKRGMSNFELIKKLRNGRQTPVKLTINKLRTESDFVTLVSSKLEADSNKLRDLLHNPTYLAEFGLDTNTVMCVIMPDSYEFYWNTSADKAFREIHKNYKRFWTEGRRQQAQEEGLNPTKATIMASIIEEETNKSDDKPNIASVYLNRLHKGMKLQADPTVKYAIGDFAIRRVTGEMLSTQSPYNTYQNEGLPPGPICTPSPSTIDAVLQAPKTTFIYFCAKADLSGASVFATTSDQHIKNARAYQKALNERGIH